MVTQIQLGNIFNSGGKSVVGGSASGLDTESLIKSLTDAKRIPATKLEEKIDLNTKKSAALSEFRSLLDKMKDASNFMRNPPGVQNAADNVFKYRTSSITSNTSVAGSNYFTATVEPGTAAQTYVIDDITQLAQATKQQSDGITATSLDDAVVVGLPGPGQIGAGLITLKGENIVLDVGDTLRDVITKINAVSGDTGISATALQVSPGNFNLIFTGTETGLSNAFDVNNPADLDDPSGVFGQLTFTTTQSAQNAMFEIDDIAITRESNNIDDLIDGVTLNLKSTTLAAPATDITLEIVPDNDLVKTGITNFINAYNDLRLFVSRQTEVGTDGKPTEEALLAGNSTLRSIMSQMTLELSKSVAGIASNEPSRLSELGITFNDYPGDDETPFTRNILTLDEAKLDSALATNFEGVRRVFEFDFSSDVNQLQVFSRTNSLEVQDMTINIDTGTGTYTASYLVDGVPTVVNLDATAITGGGGYTLKGQAGTELEGLVMIYSATTNATATVHISQGVSDRMFNALDSFLEAEEGALSVEEANIETSNQRYEAEIDRIDLQIEKFRQQLLERFASLEAALTKVNNLLQSLDAQAQARSNA